jgi:hypothetical protein
MGHWITCLARDGYGCMDETHKVDVYWATHHGRRWSVSLSESEAWQSLDSLAIYSEDPHGWTVERTHEMVPLSQGKIAECEGEMIVLDGDDYCETLKQSYKAVRVVWDCPLCGHTHDTGLYDDPVNRTHPASNPSIWYCEEGAGIVLVHW